MQSFYELRKKLFSKKAIPYYVIFLFALLLIMPQILTHSFIGGLDSYFHMNGIYEDAMQIKHFKFSYFMSMFGFNQSGRIVNAVYGPIFNYFAGFILLLCQSWVTFSIFSSLSVLFIAGLGMYLLMRKMSVQAGLATVLSGLYMVSHPVLSSWVGNQEFTGLSTCILPFVFIVGIRIARTSHIHIPSLIIIMTIALQTHLFTALISAILLSLFFFYGSFRSSHLAHLYYQACKAIGLVILLNANILAGLYEIYSGNQIIPTDPQNNLQASGLSIMQLGLGTLGLIFVTFFLALIFDKHNHINHMLIILGLVFLGLSSAYFPWNTIIKSYPILEMVVQFPQRFAPVFWIILYLVVGIYFTQFSKVKHQFIYPYIAWLIILIAIGFNVKPVFNYIQWLPRVFHSPRIVRYINSTHYVSKPRSEIRQDFASNDLTLGISDIQKSTPDYMPTNRKINSKNYMQLPLYYHMLHNIMFNKLDTQKHISNNHIKLTWHSKSDKTIILPVVAYHHTKIVYDGHFIHPKINIIGAIKLKPRLGKNTLNLHYRPSIYTKFIMSIMTISWLLTIGWWTYIGIKKTRKYY